MGQSVTGIQGTQGSQAPNHDAFAEVDLQDFIKLLVTELQSQDPMEPVDNSKILEQVSQIRSIESNTRLNTRSTRCPLGQSLSTAGRLFGRQILGLDDNGKDVAGTVTARPSSTAK